MRVREPGGEVSSGETGPAPGMLAVEPAREGRVGTGLLRGFRPRDGRRAWPRAEATAARERVGRGAG